MSHSLELQEGMEVNQAGMEVDKRDLEDRAGKQVAYGSAPEWDPSATGKEAYNDSGLFHDEAKKESAADPTSTKVDSHKIFGLRRRKLIIIGILLLVIIIVLVVGAGVGATVGHQNNRGAATAESNTQPSTAIASPSGATLPSTISSLTASSSSIGKASLTSTSLSPTATTGTATNECPSANGSTYNPGLGSSFQKLCGVDWPAGENSASGNTLVDDIAVQIAYSMDSCIDACYQHSLNNQQSTCAGVTYNANLTSSVAADKGNCFLKSAVGGNIKAGDLVESAARV